MKYIVNKDNEDVNCLKLKYIRPGEETFILLRDIIREYLLNTNNMFNGGWAIHNALKQIDPKLKLYDEDNICDTQDFDLFGYRPVEDLIKLANTLAKKIPKSDMEFKVDPGMHVNQYRLSIIYLNNKMIDLIYVSKKIYNFLSKEKIDGYYYLDAKIEIMRQYYMITNIFLLGPEKDVAKILHRINLLEKHILKPYYAKKGYWDLRKNNLNIEYTRDSDIIYLNSLVKKYISSDKLICHCGLNTYYKIFNKKDSSFIEDSPKSVKYNQEFIIHDEVFAKSSNGLLKLIQKNENIDCSKITVIYRDAFIGVIGPLYNGWIEIYYEDNLLYSFFSSAIPIHTYKNKHVSFFYNMTHCMWRELYYKYIKDASKEELYSKLIARYLKQSYVLSNNPYFKYNVHIEKFVGKYPCRNYFQVSNKLRRKKQYYFSYQAPPNKQFQNKPIKDYFYRDFEGAILLKKKLSDLKLHFNLNYLYRRDETKKGENDTGDLVVASPNEIIKIDDLIKDVEKISKDAEN